MCGIVGAINGQSVVPQLLTGLARLEYRGYDSAGIATLGQQRLKSRKAEGKLANLSASLGTDPLDGRLGIAHTRWATHGVPSQLNAHPHMTDHVAVVHNGIIENFQDLRGNLEARGRVFRSDTDSEVIPHLITTYLAQGFDPEEATFKTLQELEGTFALGILFKGVTDRLIAARRGSPLVIGRGENTHYIASDSLALSGLAFEHLFLEDGDMAVIGQDQMEILDQRGTPVIRSVEQAASTGQVAVSKGEHSHFMMKEICEQPLVVTQTLSSFIESSSGELTLPDLPVDLATIGKVHLVACGTSCNAGAIAKYWLERYAALPVEVDIASEFRYRHAPLKAEDLSIFISQSGETADTLAALRHAKAQGQKVMALVNVTESTIAREADIVIQTKAGPEIGVASTKAFTAQLTALAVFTLAAGQARGQLCEKKAGDLRNALNLLPAQIEAVTVQENDCKAVAVSLAKAHSTLFVGRGTAHPLAVEGALKLKEISYIHAEGYGAGELKHGPIALVDDQLPVIVVAPPDALLEKTLSNLQEVAARSGQIIVISNSKGVGQVKDMLLHAVEMPDCHDFTAPVLYAVPLQLIAYHTALLKGLDIDQPRNLAKSVTVE